MRRLRLIEGTGGTPAAKEGGHMKVAFATQDMKRVDAHFGGCRQLAIYDVSIDSSRFLEAVQFEQVSAEDGDHGGPDADDRLLPKIKAVIGCSLLFVLAIGGPAAARVVQNKVHPIKLREPEAIADVIERIQTMLKGNPPPWLRKVLQEENRSMDFLEEDA